MSIGLMELVDSRKMDATPKWVLHQMANRANDRGEGIGWKVREIASRCSLSERQVQRILDKLEAAPLKLITPYRPPADPRYPARPGHEPTWYRINLDALRRLPEAPHTRGDNLTPHTAIPDNLSDDNLSGDINAVEGRQPAVSGVTSAPRGPATTTTETTTQTTAETARARALPPGVMEVAWMGWTVGRRKIPRAPFPDTAEAAALNTLWKVHEAGYDCAQILEIATASGWRGLQWPLSHPKEYARYLRRHQHPIAPLGPAAREPMFVNCPMCGREGDEANIRNGKCAVCRVTGRATEVAG